ncbi:hypothetical protein ACIBJE_00355 [Micromonospora sp. NPDC050187]|uniref:hypothetical protein n=1 Tax=Micromonospora sp. NPDC050187 TaxID=3364277 RepID=UPI0037A652AE
MAGDEAERGIELLTRTLGPWHLGTVDARQKLRFWLLEEGDHAGAVRLARTEVDDRTAALGADHPDTLAARWEMISIASRTPDWPTVIAETRRLADDRARVLGPYHRDTLSTRHFVGYYLRDSGATAEAVQVFTDILADLKALERPAEQEVRGAWVGLAYALERHGDVEGALCYVEKELAAERVTFYPQDENIGQHHLTMLLEWRDRLRGRRAVRQGPASRGPAGGVVAQGEVGERPGYPTGEGTTAAGH